MPEVCLLMRIQMEETHFAMELVLEEAHAVR